MGADPQYAKWPLLPLSQHVFTLTNPYAARPAQQQAIKSLQDAISEHKMAPLYKYLAHPTDGILNAAGEATSGVAAQAQQRSLSRTASSAVAAGMMASKGATSGANLPWDEHIYQQLKADNDKELEEVKKEEDEAVEKAGDTEIMAARGKRAEFFAKIGDKVR
jgi:26S proteasome regulatory subunit N7